MLGTLLAAGCEESPTRFSMRVYTLTAVNQEPLPQPYGRADSAVEVTAGSLQVDEDGTLVEELRLRCRDPLPTGTTCTVEPDEPVQRPGTYSAGEGWVEFDGVRFPATFVPGGVTITYGVATGFPLVYEYR